LKRFVCEHGRPKIILEVIVPTALSEIFHKVLGTPAISSIRRNHGLEHATLHILSQRYPKANLAGHSNTRGFWLLGNVSTEDVRSAVEEALRRMGAGEHNLAVHANCGTNFVTAGTVAGIAGALAMSGVGRRWNERLERLPLAASLATVALILSHPLGMKIQERVTTCGEPGALQVVDIVPTRRGRIKAHQIITRG
jgi:hypothetical protein